MVREDLPSLITTSDTPIGLELGVAAGIYSIKLLQRYNFKEYYCIDSWNSRRREAHSIREYVETYNKLKQFKPANIIRATFKEVLNEIEDEYFDFIYIDGNAGSGQEKGETIFNWYCKLKPGGIYSGHDYYKKYPLTIENVNKFAERYEKQLNFTTERKFNSWWVVK